MDPPPLLTPLLTVDGSGLCCPAGGFHIDPWRPVELALVTHAHGDHARPGSRRYIAAEASVCLLRRRLRGGGGSDGEEAEIRGVPYGERIDVGGGGVTVSFHPAGHVLGSAQIRVEAHGSGGGGGMRGGGGVWVVSGDYKRDPDPTCAPFEVVPCDTFITEATFALPIYTWDPSEAVMRGIFDWWEANRAAGKASVLFCYALGKAQRILAELAAFTDRPVYAHGAVEPLTACYREAGVRMLGTRPVADEMRGRSFAGELVLAPPSAAGSPWMRRFGGGGKKAGGGGAGGFETGFASGWMRVRGIRRRRGYDRGFIVSDHADWNGLLRTVRETGATRVLAMHGYSEVLARRLREEGIDAAPLATGGGAGDDEEGE